jgi:serine-type D-Ala-D-Ala carboxypeptidase (penicillin-binding protein 5/6)
MRSVAITVLAAATLAIGVPAHAQPAAEPAATGSIGGALLTGTGVVVRPLAAAPALPRDLTSGSWLIADADTGDVLAAKAPHVRFLPASTLKTLTAVTLLPLLPPDRMVKASYADAAVDGSKVGLVPGMSYPVSTLFTAMLVVSGNDAAGALAEAAGGIPRTVALMNAQARHLQAFDTVARTPSGLDAPGERTSAYDLALIARAGLAMPAFRHYIGIVKSQIPAPHGKHFQIYTHNRLLTTYPGDIGVKNGYTVAAGATYVGAATRGGHTIIVTLMHAQPDFWAEARSLLDWGFRADGKVTPVGQLVGPAVPQQQQARQPQDDIVRPVSAVGRSASSAVAPWEIALLAVSAAFVTTVTGARRRKRRQRRRRLALPPI